MLTFCNMRYKHYRRIVHKPAEKKDKIRNTGRYYKIKTFRMQTELRRLFEIKQDVSHMKTHLHLSERAGRCQPCFIQPASPRLARTFLQICLIWLLILTVIFLWGVTVTQVNRVIKEDYIQQYLYRLKCWSSCYHSNCCIKWAVARGIRRLEQLPDEKSN